MGQEKGTAVDLSGMSAPVINLVKGTIRYAWRLLVLYIAAKAFWHVELDVDLLGHWQKTSGTWTFKITNWPVTTPTQGGTDAQATHQ